MHHITQTWGKWLPRAFSSLNMASMALHLSLAQALFFWRKQKSLWPTEVIFNVESWVNWTWTTIFTIVTTHAWSSLRLMSFVVQTPSATDSKLHSSPKGTMDTSDCVGVDAWITTAGRGLPSKPNTRYVGKLTPLMSQFSSS